MSLPPYKHTRNPCLQTEDEPLNPGLAGAPLITCRCVQEKRRTSDQRVARNQNMPGVEFEYEYVPATHTPPGSEIGVQSRGKTIFEPRFEDHRHYRQNPKIKSVDVKYVDEQLLPGESGDQLSTLEEIGECATRIHTRNNVAGKPNDRKKLKDANSDAKSTCSRRSSLSHRSLISHCSHKAEFSNKSEKSEKRSDSNESFSSTLNAVLKMPSRRDKKCEESCVRKFGRIANGLDDDDLRPRRR